ncbi:MAG: head GIN domain-containing protein [Desulfobacterales bacterium]
MARFFFSFLLFLICFVFFHQADSFGEGCIEGNGITTKEQRQVPPFGEIDINGAFDVAIQDQKKNKITVTADKNLLPHIITRVKSGKLYVFSDRSICTTSKLHIDIDNDDIKKIQSSGANDISVSGVKSDRLEIEMDGAGDINLSGKTKLFIVNLSGATDMDAENLRAETVQISLSGAGDATIYASKKLDATVSGSGTVNCSGNPQEIIKKITGAGELNEE